MDRYPVEFYTDFLDYIRERYDGEFWLAQPSEVARYWRTLRQSGSSDDKKMWVPGTLCSSCRQAYTEGWLSDYPPGVPPS